MNTNNFLKNLWLIAAASLIFSTFSTGAFAYGRDGHWARGRREVTVFRGERYHYHEGRFYRPSLFGFSFDLVVPPAGAVVSYLPYGHRTIVVGGVMYYEYDNVYYQPCPAGYAVVQQPVVASEYISPDIIYVPASAVAAPVQPQPSERETVTINVPTSNRGSIAITLVRYPNGFAGPQGEFYPTLPTAEQLRVRYGK
jgi:hypothetical protein